MKKWLLILGIITCTLGLTACGKEDDVTPFMTESAAEAYVKENITNMNMHAQSGTHDQVTEPVWIAGVESWEQAIEEIGSFEEVIFVKNKLGEEDGVIDVRVKGERREATVEFVFEDCAVVSVTTNVEYSFGEKMEKAALNTLLGMGTVFVVLILISLIIGCFGFIPKLQDKLSKKSKKKKQQAAPVDNTIAQIIEKEELSDDLELVAVIAAAIAASEGASSTDGFVVRSIRRAGTKRQRA